MSSVDFQYITMKPYGYLSSVDFTQGGLVLAFENTVHSINGFLI